MKYLIMDTEAALWEKHHKLHDKQGQARKAQMGKENINITEL